MELYNLGNKHSLINPVMKDLRDVKLQQNRFDFRKNIERIGEITAYEISKHLNYIECDTQTSLGRCRVPVIADSLVVASIMRAGLPLHQGILNYFHQAENAFISAYRKHSSETEFFIQLDYISSPSLEGKVLILADPMLATGLSLAGVYRQLLKYGKPAFTHLVSVISARQGIDYIKQELGSEPLSLWTAAVDPILDKRSYIVPGLGDAGDLAFGEKI